MTEIDQWNRRRWDVTLVYTSGEETFLGVTQYTRDRDVVTFLYEGKWYNISLVTVKWCRSIPSDR